MHPDGVLRLAHNIQGFIHPKPLSECLLDPKRGDHDARAARTSLQGGVEEGRTGEGSLSGAHECMELIKTAYDATTCFTFSILS